MDAMTASSIPRIGGQRGAASAAAGASAGGAAGEGAGSICSSMTSPCRARRIELERADAPAAQSLRTRFCRDVRHDAPAAVALLTVRARHHDVDGFAGALLELHLRDDEEHRQIRLVLPQQ